MKRFVFWGYVCDVTKKQPPIVKKKKIIMNLPHLNRSTATPQTLATPAGHASWLADSRRDPGSSLSRFLSNCRRDPSDYHRLSFLPFIKIENIN